MKHKRGFSLWLSAIYMSFFLFGSTNVFAAPIAAAQAPAAQSTTGKTQVDTAIKSVADTEQYVSQKSFDANLAQIYVKSAQAQVNIVKLMGKGYEATYTDLTNRLTAVTNKISDYVKSSAAQAIEDQAQKEAAAKQLVVDANNAVVAAEQLVKGDVATMLLPNGAEAKIQKAIVAALALAYKLPKDSVDAPALSTRLDAVRAKFKKATISSSVTKQMLTEATKAMGTVEAMTNVSPDTMLAQKDAQKKIQAAIISAQVYIGKLPQTYTETVKLQTRMATAKARFQKALDAATVKAASDALKAKQQLADATSAVKTLEQLTGTTYDKMLQQADSAVKIQAAIVQAQSLVAKIGSGSMDAVSLTSRINVANTLFTKAVAQKAAADKLVTDQTKAVESLLVKAEVKLGTSSILTKNDAFIKSAKQAVSDAVTAVKKLGSKFPGYNSFVSRMNALNDRLTQLMQSKKKADDDKANKAAAVLVERAVATLERMSLISGMDLSMAQSQEAVANAAVAKITDATMAAPFKSRISAVDAKITALKAKLDADALEAKSPAKISSVTAVDQRITVKFNKKPLSAINPGDIRITRTIGSDTAGYSFVSINPVDDTTISISVPAIPASQTADQSVVFNVQYQGQPAASAPAFTVPKIPYVAALSATALNQKQIKVVFNKAVDKATAETVANYYENGIQMASSYEKAELQADNQSVIITYASQKAQSTTTTLTVTGVKNTAGTETIANATFSLTFVDTTVPTVVSVVPNGNYSLTVNFSEPVNNATISSYYQFDGYDISNYGISTIAYDDATYPSKQTSVTILLSNPMAMGAHNLTVLASRISDMVSNYVGQTTTPFNVTTDASKPAIVSATSNGLGVLDIQFNEPVQLPAYYSITVNGTTLDSTTQVKYKDTNNRTVVEITKSALLVNGSNQFSIVQNGIYGTNGNTNNTGALTGTVAATQSTTAPIVSSLSASSASQLMIYYSTAMGPYALYPSYYYLRDVYGNTAATVTSVTPISGSNSMYYLNLSTTLQPGATYYLTVVGVADLSGNVINAAPKAFTSAGTAILPTAPTVSLVDAVHKIIKVTFNTTMDATSISTKSNYAIAYYGAASGYSALDASTTVTISDYKNVMIDFPDTANISPGTTVFETLYMKDVYGNYTISRVDANIPITNVVQPTIMNPTITGGGVLQTGGADQGVNGYYQPTSGQTITWTSSDTSVATIINNNGNITIHPVFTGSTNNIYGTSTISYYVNDSFSNRVVSGTATVYVYRASMVINPTYNGGSNLQFTGSGTQQTYAPSLGFTIPSGASITWTVSGNGTVSYNTSTGAITPNGPGNTTVSYVVTHSIVSPTSNQTLGAAQVFSGSVQVTVVPATTTAYMKLSNVQIGQPAAAATIYTDAALNNLLNLSGYTVEWAPGNSSIVDVDTAGKVTGIAAGTTTITFNVKQNNIVAYSGSKTITVIGAATTVAVPIISSTMLQVGGTKPEIDLPGGVSIGIGQHLVFISSNSSVAAVDMSNGSYVKNGNGKYTLSPLAAGTTKLSYNIVDDLSGSVVGSSASTTTITVVQAETTVPLDAQASLGGKITFQVTGRTLAAGEHINWQVTVSPAPGSTTPLRITKTTQNGTSNLVETADGQTGDALNCSYVITDGNGFDIQMGSKSVVIP